MTLSIVFIFPPRRNLSVTDKPTGEASATGLKPFVTTGRNRGLVRLSRCYS
jgi:hypothetical protein